MPGPFKVTFFFTSGTTGWSESYYSSSATAFAAMGAARVLATSRIKLCGDDIDLTHIRVSDITIKGDAVFDGKPGFTTKKVPYRGLIFVQPADPGLAADVAWTSAIFTYSNANVSVGRTFARGLPDQYFQNDRIFIPETPWRVAFNVFATDIKQPANGWCFPRKPKSTPANTAFVVGATIDTVGDVQFKINPLVLSPLGAKIALRNFKTNMGTLSGVYEVIFNDLTNIRLKTRIQNNLAVWDGRSGTFQNADTSLIGSLDATFAREATSRRAGRPFDALVGRRKRRAVLR